VLGLVRVAVVVYVCRRGADIFWRSELCCGL
jgi:hypothetical protein